MFDQGERLDAGEIAGQGAAHLVDVAGGVVVHLCQRSDEILVARDVAFHRLGDGGGGELEPVARLALKARDRLADGERGGDGDGEKDDQHERGRVGPDADELLDLMHRRPWGGVIEALTIAAGILTICPERKLKIANFGCFGAKMRMFYFA